MLQKSNDKMNSYWNQNSVIVDLPWKLFSKKHPLDKIESLIRQEADAILTTEQIKDWYYYSETRWLVQMNITKIIKQAAMYADKKWLKPMWWLENLGKRMEYVSLQSKRLNCFDFIDKKEKVIEKNIEDILAEIQNTGTLRKDSMNQYLMQSYLEQWLIKEINLRTSIVKYFVSEFYKIFALAIKPINLSIYPSKEELWKSSFDIETNVDIRDKQIIAYIIHNKLVPEDSIKSIKKNTQKILMTHKKLLFTILWLWLDK